MRERKSGQRMARVFFRSHFLLSSPLFFYLELGPNGARVIKCVKDRAFKVVGHFLECKRIRRELQERFVFRLFRRKSKVRTSR